jgi:hypothetical protein
MGVMFEDVSDKLKEVLEDTHGVAGVSDQVGTE